MAHSRIGSGLPLDMVEAQFLSAGAQPRQSGGCTNLAIRKVSEQEEGVAPIRVRLQVVVSGLLATATAEVESRPSLSRDRG